MTNPATRPRRAEVMRPQSLRFILRHASPTIPILLSVRGSAWRKEDYRKSS